MKKVIKDTVHCKNAEEFLDALSPVGEYFKCYELNAPLLFRGQGQDWSLVPSLFRENALKTFGDQEPKNYKELRLLERNILIRFFRLADQRGLVLPGDSQELRTFFATLSDDEKGSSSIYPGSKIESKALSLMALAQHYGVPTRLLDWSLHPLIAAFFAAYDAYNHNEIYKTDSFLVVWAFYFPALEKETRYSDDSYSIRSVTAPSATNINLKAQQGVFTLVNPRRTNETKGKCLPFSDIVISSPHQKSASLQKFTLLVAEANKLLYLLAKLDITPSSVFPGYESVVSDLKLQSSLGKI